MNYNEILSSELDRLKASHGLWVDEWNEYPNRITFRIGYKLRYTEVFIRFSQFETDMKSFAEMIKESYPLKKM
jgi:hypothetical protein